MGSFKAIDWVTFIVAGVVPTAWIASAKEAYSFVSVPVVTVTTVPVVGMGFAGSNGVIDTDCSLVGSPLWLGVAQAVHGKADAVIVKTMANAMPFFQFRFMRITSFSSPLLFGLPNHLPVSYSYFTMFRK